MNKLYYLLFITIFIFATQVSAAIQNCDNCTDCTQKVATAATGDTIRLSNNISSIGTCIDIQFHNHTTLDCNNYSIFGTNGQGRGIRLNYSTNVTIKDCYVSTFDRGILARNCNNISILDSSVVNNTDIGILAYYMNNLNISGVNVYDSIDYDATYIGLSKNIFVRDYFAFNNGDSGLLFDATNQTHVYNASFQNNSWSLYYYHVLDARATNVSILDDVYQGLNVEYGANVYLSNISVIRASEYLYDFNHNDNLSLINAYGSDTPETAISFDDVSNSVIMGLQILRAREGLLISQVFNSTFNDMVLVNITDWGALNVEASDNLTFDNADMSGLTGTGFYLSYTFNSRIYNITIVNPIDSAVEIDRSNNNTFRYLNITKEDLTTSIYHSISNGVVPKNDIDATNTINGKPIRYYDGKYVLCPNNQTISFGYNASFIGLLNCDNVTVTDTWGLDSVALLGTNYSTLQNISFQGSGDAIVLIWSVGNQLINSTLQDISTAFTIRGKTRDNIFTGNRVENATTWLFWNIALGVSYPNGNLYFNNIFNTTNKVMTLGSLINNTFNTTKAAGINIVGGSFIGGNYWARPDGLGWSENCTNITDSICNDIYNLSTGVVDYLPLVISGGNPLTCVNCSDCTQKLINLSQGQTLKLAADLFSTGDCMMFNNVSNITLDCDGHNISGDGVGNDYGISNDDYWVSGNIYNLTIQNCPAIMNFRYGINFHWSTLSTFRNIKYFDNEFYGLYIDISSHTTVIDNHNIAGGGLSFIDSNNTRIYNSSSFFTDAYGLEISGSRNINSSLNLVIDNFTGNYNDFGGVVLEGFQHFNATITNIEVNNNGVIGLSGLLDYSTVQNVVAKNNADYGMNLDWSNHTTISNIFIENSSATGLEITRSSYVVGRNITLNVSGQPGTGSFGVLVSECVSCSFYDHEIHGFNYSFDVWDSINNTLVNLTLRNPVLSGLTLDESVNNTFRNISIFKSSSVDPIWHRPSTVPFRNDIDTSNTINGIPVRYYDGLYNPCPNDQILDFDGNASYISLMGCHNVTLSNNAELGGISLLYTNDSTLLFNNITGSGSGIMLEWSNRNTISGSLIEDVRIGYYLRSDTRMNTIKDSVVQDATTTSVWLRYTTPKNNSFYNNIFNSSTPIISDSPLNYNIWNTSNSPGTNIIGGAYIGGNYWVRPDSLGWSENCTSATDGICDDQYNLSINNTDFLPLSSPQSIVVTLGTPANGYSGAPGIITFSWTVNGSSADYLCNITIDGSVRSSNLSANVSVSRSYSQYLGAGSHTWNVSCWDNASLIGNSLTRTLTLVTPVVNPPSGGGSRTGGGGGIYRPIVNSTITTLIGNRTNQTIPEVIQSNMTISSKNETAAKINETKPAQVSIQVIIDGVDMEIPVAANIIEFELPFTINRFKATVISMSPDSTLIIRPIYSLPENIPDLKGTNSVFEFASSELILEDIEFDFILPSLDLKKNEVRMFRFHDRWIKLNTELLEDDGVNSRFRAHSPGFSYFAIAVHKTFQWFKLFLALLLLIGLVLSYLLFNAYFNEEKEEKTYLRTSYGKIDVTSIEGTTKKRKDILKTPYGSVDVSYIRKLEDDERKKEKKD